RLGVRELPHVRQAGWSRELQHLPSFGSDVWRRHADRLLHAIGCDEVRDRKHVRAETGCLEIHEWWPDGWDCALQERHIIRCDLRLRDPGLSADSRRHLRGPYNRRPTHENG